MKKRQDLRAAAAYRDIHDGLTMAIKGATELLCTADRDAPADVPSPAVKALEKVALRVAKAARRRVVVHIDNDIPADIYIGEAP